MDSLRNWKRRWPRRRSFCEGFGVNLGAIANAEKLARLQLIRDAVKALIAPDERRRDYLPKAGLRRGLKGGAAG